MITNNSAYSTVGWIALIAGIAGILATVLIFLFYTVGGPFGTLNDIFNGVAGFLSGILAWRLFSELRLTSSFLPLVGLILAFLGAVVVLIGSILIIFDFTGWVLAGWYTTLGNALIGIWLILLSYSMRKNSMFPQNLSTFGLFVGVIMAVGILAMLGIWMKIDSTESTPGYLNLGYLGFLGSYFLYPAWTIWLGRTLLSR